MCKQNLTNKFLAVYLGVVDYGKVQASDKDNFMHRFFIKDKEVTYRVSNANDYKINNILAEGYVFNITIQDNTVVNVSIPSASAIGKTELITSDTIKVDGVAIDLTNNTKIYRILNNAGGSKVNETKIDIGETVRVYGNPADVIFQAFTGNPYIPTLKGVPGLKTLKNFLATSFEPVGATLYIYGGGWDWQDVGSSNQSISIGLPGTWLEFFQSKDDSFNYKNESDFSKSYYPNGSYNQYYYAGADCSGYVGWAMYNLFNTKNGNNGYVMASTQMANNYANVQKFGYHYRTFDSTSFETSTFKPGDIFSMRGHVWICVGVCNDGSIVILNSTPSNSISNYPGGGVQLSSIGARTGVGSDKNCEAYKLVKTYMARYYSEWSKRYIPVHRDYSLYTDLSTSEITGKFQWNIDGSVLSDPDGYAHMKSNDILKDLFREN